MILKNGLVMDENFKLVRADVRIHGEEIAEIGEIRKDSQKTEQKTVRQTGE